MVTRRNLNDPASLKLSLVPTLCPPASPPKRNPADFFYANFAGVRILGLAAFGQPCDIPGMIHNYSHPYLRKVLNQTQTIAAVGVSLNEVRPSYFVARYLSMMGFDIIPVNPVYAGKRAFGRKVVPDLASISKKRDPIHMVDIFRRSDQAGQVVDEALDVLLDRGLKYIWMQIGVIDKAAAKRAEAKGVEVLMNICPKMEYQRLWGELSRGGINSGVVTSKLGYVNLQLPDAP